MPPPNNLQKGEGFYSANTVLLIPKVCHFKKNYVCPPNPTGLEKMGNLSKSKLKLYICDDKLRSCAQFAPRGKSAPGC